MRAPEQAMRATVLMAAPAPRATESRKRPRGGAAMASSARKRGNGRVPRPVRGAHSLAPIGLRRSLVGFTRRDREPAADQGESAVDTPDEAEAVSGDEDGPALEPRPQGLRQRQLAVGVEMGRRLVQEHEGSVSQHGAGDGDALALSGAQRQASLTDRGLETVWQSFEKP